MSKWWDSKSGWEWEQELVVLRVVMQWWDSWCTGRMECAGWIKTAVNRGQEGVVHSVCACGAAGDTTAVGGMVGNGAAGDQTAVLVQ